MREVQDVGWKVEANRGLHWEGGKGTCTIATASLPSRAVAPSRISLIMRVSTERCARSGKSGRPRAKQPSVFGSAVPSRVCVWRLGGAMWRATRPPPLYTTDKTRFICSTPAAHCEIIVMPPPTGQPAGKQQHATTRPSHGGEGALAGAGH